MLTSLRSLLFRSPADSRLQPWACEVARACIAFAIYVTSGTLDVSPEVGGHYWSAIAAGTQPVLKWTQHFREPPEVARDIPSNQHTHLVLILALFLVSWRLPLRRRVVYFGFLATLAVVQDWVAATLSLRLHEAKMLYEQLGWLMLLPWEYDTFQVLWYLVYAVPLQAAPFLLFLLTALWNADVKPAEFIRRLAWAGEAGLPARESSSRPWSSLRPRIVPTLAGILLVAGIPVGAGMWSRIRERNPLHLRSHVSLGNARLLEGKVREAEAEYRHAVETGTVEGEAWLRLARVQVMLGERQQAVEILRKAAWVVGDPTWRNRIQAELEALGSSDPYRPPSIGVVDPAVQP